MFLDTAVLQNTLIGQFILPFAIIFAVAYGSLGTAGVFKDKNVNILTAAVIAFVSATYAPLVDALWLYFPYVAGLLILLFIYNLVKTVLFGKSEETPPAQAGKGKEGEGGVVLITGAVLVILALSSESIIPDLPGIDSTNVLFIIALLAIWVIVKRGYGKPEGMA